MMLADVTTATRGSMGGKTTTEKEKQTTDTFPCSQRKNMHFLDRGGVHEKTRTHP